MGSIVQATVPHVTIYGTVFVAGMIIMAAIAATIWIVILRYQNQALSSENQAQKNKEAFDDKRTQASGMSDADLQSGIEHDVLDLDAMRGGSEPKGDGKS